MDALQAAFAMLHWPAWLLAIPLPWLLARIVPVPAAQGDALRLPIADAAQAIATGPAAPSTRRFGVLAALAWASLCIAAARPQLLGPPIAPPVQGRDILLALDLSGSMRETDMDLGGGAVDRLTAAKAVLADFIDRRAGDRLSLLVFGRQAHVLTPFTPDRASVREQLSDAVVGLAGQETAIGDAIGLATRRLRLQRSGQRVVILLTDGVNTAGALEPLHAARIAADDGVRIHTIAFGGDGMLSLFGFRSPIGATELDEAMLRQVARSTGGRFFRARDVEELAQIYAEIDRIEPVDRPGRAVRPRREMYAWPLAAALGFALLAALVGRRTR
ncbi:vWA domain-containing protein [Lysobacter humi (ex Lee et al. 2017)]